MIKQAGLWVAALIVFSSLAVPSRALAENDTFDKGSLVLQTTGSYTVGYAVFDLEYASGVIGEMGLGYYPRDRFGVYLAGAGYHLTHVDPETSAAGGGLNLLLRYHFYEFADDKATAFIDLGGGLIRLDHEWPDNGTHNNFTGRLGLGLSYDLNEDFSLVGGLRWFHLSNAYRHGRDENPNYDGVEAWAGILWTLK